MIIGVATDIHLDCVTIDKHKRNKIIRIGKNLTDGLDHLIVSGDISTFRWLPWHMEALFEGATCPVHWIMGNHDYWGASFREADKQAEKIKGYIHNKVVELNDKNAIIGINSWFDGRLGDINNLWDTNDHLKIANLYQNLNRDHRKVIQTVRNRADHHAGDARIILEANAGKYDKIFFVTHYPPWNNPEDDKQYYPWSVNSKMGEILFDIATKFPHTEFEVIAGHTHHWWQHQVTDNMVLKIEKATYKQPKLGRKFEL